MKRDSRVSQAALWLVLYGALLAQTYRYSSGAIFYGEYLHWTGLQATHLLFAALAVTPVRRLFPKAGWSAWLLLRRRDIGVAVFAYAVAHAVAYLWREPVLAEIVADALTAGMLTGWLALLVFLPLAATSNDRSVRRLGQRWKVLHSFVYAGALLTLAHWVLTAFDPATAYVYLAVLIALLGLRVVKPRRNRTAG
ncbi:MAG: ferric reductase-like transmembrane domain-containing protein [Woeseiaceae bacterium]|nr:ferric reductase-like transmembrane domain-containing protein [Woeseiaceae bacterium]